jgi:ATP-dependent DNA helicase RecQ
MNAHQILQGTFGFSSYRPGQEKVINALIRGKNVLAVMPTGAGKSLCYQIPAIASRQRTVVISPLVALMDDQVSVLKELGVQAERIHSGRERFENVTSWKQFQRDTGKLLYVSPERLMTEKMLSAIDRLDIGMFVVDEAHCISKWGPSFRPDYEDLSKLSEMFPNAVIAAFTATADEGTRADIMTKLSGGNGITFVQGFDRPNLFLSVIQKSSWKMQLLDFLEDKRGSSGIVYCLSRKRTEEVASLLIENGIDSIAYHAGQESSQRRESQDRFMSEGGLVMAATIAFGMGIDKSDIRFVAHVNLPGNMESYYQEIGRGGRDGAPSETLLMYGLDDVHQRRRFIEEDSGDEMHRMREHKRLDALLAYCEAASCRRKALLSYFGDDIDACGNCDNCLNPPNVIDGTELGRLFLSAVYRTGQSFGAGYVVDVLRGSKTEKVVDREHDQLTTFGIGSEYPKEFWHGFLRQLLAAGHIVLNIQYGSLQISPSGLSILEGDSSYEYKEITVQKIKSRKSVEKKLLQDSQFKFSETDSKLLSRLKSLRLSLAREQGVPAFVVFADAVLFEMINRKPRNTVEFEELNGVGPVKLERYSEAFLEVLMDNGPDEGG